VIDLTFELTSFYFSLYKDSKDKPSPAEFAEQFVKSYHEIRPIVLENVPKLQEASSAKPRTISKGI